MDMTSRERSRTTGTQSKTQLHNLPSSTRLSKEPSGFDSGFTAASGYLRVPLEARPCTNISAAISHDCAALTVHANQVAPECALFRGEWYLSPALALALAAAIPCCCVAHLIHQGCIQLHRLRTSEIHVICLQVLLEVLYTQSSRYMSAVEQ